MCVLTTFKSMNKERITPLIVSFVLEGPGQSSACSSAEHAHQPIAVAVAAWAALGLSMLSAKQPIAVAVSVLAAPWLGARRSQLQPRLLML